LPRVIDERPALASDTLKHPQHPANIGFGRTIFVVDDQFGVMCLDGVITGASSAAVLAAMRALRPEVPVLLCSGYVDEELLLRGIQVGELTCVRKPFHLSELVTAILQKLEPPGTLATQHGGWCHRGNRGTSLGNGICDCLGSQT
jgi:DNA-binding NtrC family response regulator